MKKVYLIDSENVNDSWVPLIALKEEELLVFYTSKSPHMSYDNLIKLKESSKKVKFIKCFEGTNALDFQLVSELGFRIRDMADCEYIIVTNDTGFDAVVRYWSEKKYSVRRVAAKFIKNELKCTAHTEDEKPVKESGRTPSEKPVKESDKAPLEKPVKESARTPLEKTEKQGDDKEEVLKLIACIGSDKNEELHNALVQIYGEKGKEIYQEIKSEPVPEDYKDWNDVKRFKTYCEIVLNNSGLEVEDSRKVSDYLYTIKDKGKNLNSFRAAILKKYKKDLGSKYYALFKVHIKRMNDL
jgi:hypothetical protein